MKRFAFKLEKIRRLRSWTESEARLELGRVVSERNAIEQALINTAQKRSAAMAERSASQQTLNEFRIYESYLSRLDAEKEKLIVKAAQADIKVEAAREVWQEAQSEFKTIENLKERRAAEHRKEIFVEEEREIADSRPPAPLT